MIRIISIFLAILALSCGIFYGKYYSKEISTSPKVSLASIFFDRVDFVSRYFGEGDWKATLAMNIKYKPIKALRNEIEKKIMGQELLFFKGWNPNGEAHVTTITPVEYQNCMWSKERKIKVLHMRDIEDIATSMHIQDSDMTVVGVGSGVKDNFEGREGIKDETFFVIIESDNLIDIRKNIYEKYLKNGGDPGCWNPTHFFPHVTIGFTHQDIHEPDVYKDEKNSLDDRMHLVIRR